MDHNGLFPRKRSCSRIHSYGLTGGVSAFEAYLRQPVQAIAGTYLYYINSSCTWLLIPLSLQFGLQVCSARPYHLTSTAFPPHGPWGAPDQASWLAFEGMALAVTSPLFHCFPHHHQTPFFYPPYLHVPHSASMQWLLPLIRAGFREDVELEQGEPDSQCSNAQNINSQHDSTQSWQGDWNTGRCSDWVFPSCMVGSGKMIQPMDKNSEFLPQLWRWLGELQPDQSVTN